MIAFLFILSVFAQETEQPTNACSAGMYFNVNSGEGGKCETVNNCNTTIDTFAGCEVCNDGYFLFKGQCYPCNCGSETIECTNDIGCPKCAEKHVMVETKFADKSAMYTCTQLTGEVPDLTDKTKVFTEYQIHGNDTLENCLEWGNTGCTKCNTYNTETGKYYYLNASMCYENTHCTDYDKENNVCTNCTQAKTQNDVSYYLLNGVCTQCDGNCTKCELETGYCQECFPGYYPLNKQSKKCYQCDPNCEITHCIQLDGPNNLKQGSCTKCRSDPSRNETYYLVNNTYCIRMPYGCTAAETNKGCTACRDGFFLVRHDYKGKGNFHYNIDGVNLGMCVPHQEACPEVNRTETGCKGCSAGYVLDTITWTGEDKKSHEIGICSGTMSVMILALIALLVLLF